MLQKHHCLDIVKTKFVKTISDLKIKVIKILQASKYLALTVRKILYMLSTFCVFIGAVMDEGCIKCSWQEVN